MKSRAQRYRYVRHVVSGTRPSPWSPLSLGSLLAAWYKADAGCYTDAACLFASASSQYLSRGSSEAVLNGSASGFWRAAWVYITDLSTFRGIMGDNPNSASGYDFYVNASGQAVFRGSNGTTLVAATGAGGAVTTGAWFFIYAHYTGVKAQISVNNGSFADSANYTFVPVAAGSTSLYVGRTAAGNFKMEGAIARAFGGNGNLSGAQITTLYNAGAGLFYADLGATLQSACGFAYNLCEGSSTRVDSVGALNLTPTNGPTVAAGPGEGLAVTNSPWTRLNDQSGNGKHLTQTTISKELLYVENAQNGRPGLRADGTDDSAINAALSVAQPFAVFVVAKNNVANGGSSYIFDDDEGTSRVALAAFSLSKVGLYCDSGPIEAAHTYGAAHVYEGYGNGASSELFVDGVSAATGDAGTSGFGGIRIASRFNEAAPLDGDIYEILIVASPTAGQRASARAYLRARWGI